MCLQDLQLSQMRYTKSYRVSAVTNGTFAVAVPNASRLLIAFAYPSHSLVQPQTAGVGVIGMDGNPDNWISYYFTLYNNFVQFKVEEYGSMVTGGWSFINGLGTATLVIVREVIATAPLDAQIRR